MLDEGGRDSHGDKLLHVRLARPRGDKGLVVFVPSDIRPAQIVCDAGQHGGSIQRGGMRMLAQSLTVAPEGRGPCGASQPGWLATGQQAVPIMTKRM